ncbi:nitronate monooxygenase [Lysobacter sp. KIS68-7]|uniref:NAD(P)H-dependent flavin oxidoreductase n=1 Tax=Lysobacter sp. KIS68-7 TaxID=2904252 RepID=UPI001E4BD3EB|nr:nitronate monooxygenase [Lysobacter sp. KIS68-7]UHQ20057.1 nitronate monooxygenase [Lysobacter sp. KIS68-7]
MMAAMANAALLDRLGIGLPIVQAPMAGVSTPAMAAAASNAGALGSLGVGAMTADQAREAIRAFKAASAGPLHVNVFTHRPARVDPHREAAWLQRLQPEFERFHAQPPAELREVYTSFLVDDAMCAMLCEERPRVVSFHFGLARTDQIVRLRGAGIVLLATATCLREARAIETAGLDAIVAQGFEAGGHRGVFDPDADDARMTTADLVRTLAQRASLPIVAAGGLMDGADIAAMLALGASAAQLGTAFVATDESLADAGYRARLLGEDAHHTQMTRAISGRPARCLRNDFTRLGDDVAPDAIPDYPIAYDAGKALHAAAKAAGSSGWGAQWAGEGAPRVRPMSTQRLVQTLAAELGH